uniref:Pyruvate synthase subunit PorD n=1 Tax=Thermofilum pendens TaxID=2269 RepID=A0A7C4B8I9_THEPE
MSETVFAPKSWRDLPLGNVIPLPMTSLSYKTGNWRALRPELHKEKCVKCLLCWVHCPEPAIHRHEDDSVSINYDFCKGCGICANVCPMHAIEMVMEG